MSKAGIQVLVAVVDAARPVPLRPTCSTAIASLFEQCDAGVQDPGPRPAAAFLLRRPNGQVVGQVWRGMGHASILLEDLGASSRWPAPLSTALSSPKVPLVQPTGMGIWRSLVPRPDGLERTDLTYGGPCYIAGYCPTSENSIYAYLVEPKRDRDSLDPALYAEEMRRLAKGYGGFWEQIRETITDPRLVNYTWFDRLLVGLPWHRGRVVLAGDAAHCCPPTLAQGAAMSLEDVSVLAEMLASATEWDDALLTAYGRRRFPRVEAVVNASVQLGQWLMDGVRDADVPGLLGRTTTLLLARP